MTDAEAKEEVVQTVLQGSRTHGAPVRDVVALGLVGPAFAKRLHDIAELGGRHGSLCGLHVVLDVRLKGRWSFGFEARLKL